MVTPITDSRVIMMKKIFCLILSVFCLSFAANAQSTLPALSRAKPVRKMSAKHEQNQTLQLGAVLWGDLVELKTSDGRTEGINLSYTGVSLSYAYSFLRFSNSHLQAGAKGYFLTGKAKSKGSSIDFQSDTDKFSAPLVFINGLYYPAKNISLGIGVDVMYYVVNLPRPVSTITVYEFSYSPKVQSLYHIDLIWLIDSTWSIRQSLFSSLATYSSAGWDMSLGFSF